MFNYHDCDFILRCEIHVLVHMSSRHDGQTCSAKN